MSIRYIQTVKRSDSLKKMSRKIKAFLEKNISNKSHKISREVKNNNNIMIILLW